MIDPLIIVRDIHFASSMIVAGIIFFDLLIAWPTLRSASRFPRTEQAFRQTVEKILVISLPLSLVSAVAWVWLLAMRIAHKPFDEVLADGTIWTVLTQTQFGFAWGVRLAAGVLLAVCLLLQSKASKGGASIALSSLAAGLAAVYLGSLAFAGHGTEGSTLGADIHLTADVLHLIAAGLWLGALVPFVLSLGCLRRFEEDSWASPAVSIGNRFSTLGILAVGILLVSGVINASFLLAGLHSLIDTSYGRLLLVKVLLFLAMLSLAAVNRQHLLPRLRDDAKPGQASRTVWQLLRNSLVEIALGGAIILVVGVLGIMVPANEMAEHLH